VTDPNKPQILADDAPHILVVDDDKRIRALLSRFLMDKGYRVTTAQHVVEATTCLKNFAFDLIILDVMMPGESGLSFAARLRIDSAVPILMLSALAETEARVRGLEAGADDYLGKPFEPRELVLRVAALLRRSSPRLVTSSSTIACFGRFTFHLDRGELRRGEELMHLTEREREILRLLLDKPSETISRDDLGGIGEAGSERSIDVQINRLRRKIEDDPANPLYIQTVRGLGYRMLIDP
jgi:two-component system, OmpR family, phosphate regulon response regulator OmpR